MEGVSAEFPELENIPSSQISLTEAYTMPIWGFWDKTSNIGISVLAPLEQ
jgi:hypothetical protein